MATLPQIRDRIVTKYQSLPTQKEKLGFLYRVQERLRIVHNNKGQQFSDGQITEQQWTTFKIQWNEINERVAGHISTLREKVFTKDYGLALPDIKDEIKTNAWMNKKQELKTAATFDSVIDTIWL